MLFVYIDDVLNRNSGPLPEGFEQHWLFRQDTEPVVVVVAVLGGSVVEADRIGGDRCDW